MGTAKDPLLGDPNWVASRIFDAGAAYGLQFTSSGGLLVGVDADTPDEIEVAREFFEALGIEYRGPSVTTPGVKRDDGTHHHWDGGHYYIVLDSPHGLSAASKKYTGSSGAHVDVCLGNRYFLGPQSLRSEGKYEFTGIVYEASTESFLKALNSSSKAKPATAKRAAPQARIRAPKTDLVRFESIEDWEAATSWDDILLPFDFEYRGMTSQGAMQYLRAGGGGERSLIAYDEPGNVRIHVFSSGIPELEAEKSYSKLQAHALLHGLEISDAMSQLGIKRRPKRAVRVEPFDPLTFSDTASDDAVETPRVSKAKLTLEAAREMVTVHKDKTGSMWMSEASRTHVVEAFSDDGEIAAKIATEAYESHGQIVSKSDLANAFRVLAGEAATKPRTQTPYQRVFATETGTSSGLGGARYIYTGDETDSVIMVTENGWGVVNELPRGKFFERSNITGELKAHPDSQVADLQRLSQYVTVENRDFRSVIAWLAATWVLTESPVAMLTLISPHGSAKTSSTEVLVSVSDPQTTKLCSMPKDSDDLYLKASKSRVFAIDNVSTISREISDALCVTVTGGSADRRTLYTTNQVTSIPIRNAVIINGLSTGFTRADLASRMQCATLYPIDADKRRTERELKQAFAIDRPFITGAMLCLVAEVLGVLPSVQIHTTHRLADMMTLCQAVDEILDKHGLFLDSTKARISLEETEAALAADALEEDLVMSALTEAVRQDPDRWIGISGKEILEILTGRLFNAPEAVRPRSPHMVRSILTERKSQLERAGFTVEMYHCPSANALRYTFKPPTAANAQ